MAPSTSSSLGADVRGRVEREGATSRLPDETTSWPYKEMLLRVLSSLAALPILVGAVWAGGLWFAGLASLAAAAATHEYIRLVYPRPRALRALAILTSASLPLIAASSGLGVAFMTLVVATLLAWVMHLLWSDNVTAEHGMGHMAISVLLPAGALAALAVIRVGPSGLGWATVALAATWANDTLSFFVGKSVGRHRLLPRVSPHKTWEGLLGGVVGSLLATAIFGTLLVPELTTIDILAITAITSIAGPLGDLSKSMVKRAHQVKDFGTILPGHGGVLDRIDALLFNAPLILLWLHWAHPITA